jgi:hypothetical protein
MPEITMNEDGDFCVDGVPVPEGTPFQVETRWRRKTYYLQDVIQVVNPDNFFTCGAWTAWTDGQDVVSKKIGAGCSEITSWSVNWSRVFPGDYLIKMPNGTVEVCTEDALHGLYEEVPV